MNQLMGPDRWVTGRARIAPEDVAIVTAQGETTYRELAAGAKARVAELARLGVRPGDRVAYSGPAGAGYFEALCAASGLGAAFAPVNPGLPMEAVATVLSNVAPRVLYCAGGSWLAGAELGAGAPIVVEVGADGRPAPGRSGTPGAEPVDPDTGVVVGATDAAASHGLESVLVPGDRLALLVQTSGTTGVPKGVMLSRANVLWELVNMASIADIRGSDRILVAATLYRMGGVAMSLQSLFCGATVMFPSDKAPADLLRHAVGWRASIVFGGTSQLKAVADEPAWPTADLTALRQVFVGGEPVDEAMVRRFAERAVHVVGGYGLSEAAPLLLYANPDDTSKRPGTAGSPPPAVDIRIVGPDGADVADDVAGELIARGPNIMAGYWRRPAATREKIRDGWLYTGDAARREADGAIRILGRLEDAMRTRAGLVFSAEVEALATSHEGVVAAVAVGIPLGDGSGSGPGRFERVGVAVVARPGGAVDAPAIAAALGEALPVGCDPVVAVVPSIPLSAAGKPLRAELAKVIAASQD